jgi:heat shock protein HslJ
MRFEMTKAAKFWTLTVGVILFCFGGMASAEPLAGSEWKPIEMDGTVLEQATDAFVRFELDGNIVGNGGCNSLRGRYVTNEDAILFGPIASTMMACEDDISRIEFGFLQALAKARRYSRQDTILELVDAEGNFIVRLQQTDAD